MLRCARFSLGSLLLCATAPLGCGLAPVDNPHTPDLVDAKFDPPPVRPIDIGEGRVDGGVIFGFDDGFPFGGDIDGFLVNAGGPQPSFGATITQANPPPALSGGTLVVLRDGKTAVAADPDRDQVFVVDLGSQKVQAVTLQPGDEPGRLAEDGAGRVHVALRRGGVVVTIDPAQGAILDRRAVCPAPRGIAWDSHGDLIHVACAGGELVSLPAAGGNPTRTLLLDRDLRDVVVGATRLFVTTFRTAELLTLDGNGAIVERRTPPMFQSPIVRKNAPFVPDVAWRSLIIAGDTVAMVHQRAQATDVVIQPGGYGGDGGKCDSSIVQGTVTVFPPTGPPPVSGLIQSANLPVDIAVTADSQRYAVVAAGNGRTPGLPQVAVVGAADLTTGGDCLFGASARLTGLSVSAVAGLAGGFVVQTREPATLQILDSGNSVTASIPLSQQSRRDTGHDIFHSATGGGIACASCHPEGGEDGRVWVFDPIGSRRTQSLRGGVLALAPFHWDGDLADMPALVGEVLLKRMGGLPLAPDQVNALAHWLDGVPYLPLAVPSDPQAVARGRALFDDLNNVGCAGCHGGPKMTTHQKVDVGTGGQFIVPSLRGVGWRAPFLHDGRAAVLADRFGPGGGGDQHGLTSQLGRAQIADLVAYLESL